jgi:hypothetical protein
MSGFSAEDLAAEVTHRELAALKDFECAEHLRRHVTVEDAAGIGPLAVRRGTVYPLHTSLPSVSTRLEDDALQPDGNLSVPIAASEPPTARAAFVGLWSSWLRRKKAAIYEVESELAIAEDGRLTMPFGPVAQAVLEDLDVSYEGRSRVPNQGEESIFDANGRLYTISYDLLPETAVTFAFPAVETEDGESRRIAEVSLQGPLEVLYLTAYQKVVGSRVLHSKSHDQTTLPVNFPADLTTFHIPVPQDCERILTIDGQLISIRSGSQAVIEAGTTIADLEDQARHLTSGGAHNLEALGITSLKLPDIGLRGHRAIADTLGWVDDTRGFIERTARYDLNAKVQEVASEHIRALGRDAVRAALAQNMAKKGGAKISGARAVSRYLRDYLSAQSAAA